MKLNEELKSLNDDLTIEQGKLNEIKEQIEEYKAKMAAQNQQISKRLAEKEQREAQVQH